MNKELWIKRSKELGIDELEIYEQLSAQRSLSWFGGKTDAFTTSRVLGVSRSGFYRFRRRAEQPAKRHQQRMALDKLVVEAFAARKMWAGAPHLVLDLHDQGHKYDCKTVVASMR